MDEEMREFTKEVRQAHISMAGALGRLEEGQKNSTAYIGAVAANVKDLGEKLDDHKQDDGAHGIKTARRIFGGIIALVTLAVTCLEMWHTFRTPERRAYEAHAAAVPVAGIPR